MNLFAINMGLAFLWATLLSDLSLPTLLAGYALGFGLLWLVQPLYAERSPYFLRTWRIAVLIVRLVYEIIVSSVAVVWDVLTPEPKSQPRILELPLEMETDFGILMITNFISLTPGTLSLDVSEDRKTLVVHAMFAADPDSVIAGLKRYQRWVKEAVE